MSQIPNPVYNAGQLSPEEHRRQIAEFLVARAARPITLTAPSQSEIDVAAKILASHNVPVNHPNIVPWYKKVLRWISKVLRPDIVL